MQMREFCNFIFPGGGQLKIYKVSIVHNRLGLYKKREPVGNTPRILVPQICI